MKNTIFEIGSMVAFYILFFIMMFILLVFKSNSMMVILPLLYCILFLVRIIVRRKNLKDLNYFDLNEKGYVSDAEKRGDQLGDIFAILVFLFLALSVNEDLFKDFGNSTIGISLFCCIFYFAIANVSISKNMKLFKVIAIFMSTIQGLLILLIGITIILLSVISISEGRGIQSVQSLISMFNDEFIVSLCYFAESSLREIILIMIISIILYLVFIICTPPYQLEELATAFKIVNLVLIILSIFIYFFTNMSWISIQEFIKEINIDTNFYHLKYLTLTHDTTKYLQSFSKSNIINAGYILFLPYTLGAVISNFTIEILKKYYTKKASNTLDEIIYLREKNLIVQERISLLEKQYIFWGGDKYLLKVHDRLYDLEVNRKKILK
ncbi:hypothetical protein [Clostridium intestinale]|uniref:Uncharacterized protein n=1 Tax=Clostridium intestinale DSM 6191 TaxID=1121320 RepID=A0A1M6A527_9CLOT|nr:hypothetical protein [Clostridium intestinale]SHI31586.1 hypothetical protein SAMN02745941_03616 [Clostridium intestinale DSM 6191]